MFGCLANRLKQSRRLAKENNIYFFARLLKKDAIPQILEYNIRPEQVIARQSKI